MSEALTWTVDGKVDLSWEDLELPGHPEGCRHRKETRLLLGAQLLEMGETGKLWSSALLHCISLFLFLVPDPCLPM